MKYEFLLTDKSGTKTHPNYTIHRTNLNEITLSYNEKISYIRFSFINILDGYHYYIDINLPDNFDASKFANYKWMSYLHKKIFDMHEINEDSLKQLVDNSIKYVEGLKNKI